LSEAATRTTAAASQASGLLDIARAYAASPHRWPTEPRFDPISRWYTLLAEAASLPDSDIQSEVWLLSWLPGQATDLHDHGGSAGAFVVVAGEVLERTVTGDDVVHETYRSYRAGVGRSFDAHHVHRIVNNGTVPAVTVHAYGPALTSMTKYEVNNGRLEVVAVDRAGASW
jgi:hypothetical protein